jgi:nicotinamidase/pyrazinamidase
MSAMKATNESSRDGLAQGARGHRPGLAKQLGLHASDALLVVDLQRDFLPGGALGIAAAQRIIAPLNAYIDAFESHHLPIFLTRDWHPENHSSFSSTGGPWPAHCIRGSTGAQWAEGLHVVASARVISKGMDPSAEGYSGFADTGLLATLRDLGVRRLFVGGLATDYCVRATVLDARSHGFDVVLLADAILGVNATAGDEMRAITEMLSHGATMFCRSHSPGTNARSAPENAPPGYSHTDYGFGRTTQRSFDDAVEHVIEALRAEGFGVLADIDVAGTLNKKVGAALPPYRILGACNPTLAQRALEAEPSIGLLLPCNVVVREDAGGVVHVEFLDPAVLSTLTRMPAIAELAAEVRQKLLKVMSAL